MPTSRPTTVAYCATSLDGFLARPDGDVDWLGAPEPGEDYGWAAFFAAIDALVMGRRTFEKVLEFGSWPYGSRPVVVLSTTLQQLPRHLDGKAEVCSLPPATLLARLAAGGHRRVYVDGGLTVQSFLRADLLDELVLTRVPIMLGAGLPLFGALDQELAWEHVTTRAFAGRGLVQSSYRRRRARAS